jgi:hypothetical protein
VLIGATVLLLAACGDDSGTDVPLGADNYAVEAAWTDLYDSGESSENRGDDPAHVVAGDGVVVVSGQAGATYEQLAYVVRAHHGATGKLLWEDRVESPDCQNAAGSMVLRGHELFVNGTECGKLVVRAYDLASGSLLWEEIAAGHEKDSPGQLLRCGDAVVSVDETYDGVVWIQARSAVSGALRWQIETPALGGTRSACDERTLVVAVSGGAPGEPAYQHTGGYDVASGVLRWENEDVASMPTSRVYTMAVGVGSLISFVETRDPQSYWLTAHAVESGELLWVEPVRKYNFISDIVVSAERTHIVGVAGRRESPSDYWRNEFYVASRATVTGKRLWTSRRRVLADEQAEWAMLDGRRLLVGGWENQLRVYDAITGELAWESTDHVRGHGQDIATDGKRFYALAEVRPNDDPADDEDFFLRAYREVSP